MSSPSLANHPAFPDAVRQRLARFDSMWIARYLLALSLFGVALASRFGLQGVLPPQGFPFLTFFPAVMLAAWLGGLGPGLLVSALSTAAAWYYFFAPVRGFLPLSRPDTVALVFFSLILLVDCVIIHVMNQALDRVRRTKGQLRASEHRLRQVLDQVFVGVAILDLEGCVREINAAGSALAGVEPKSMVGRKLWEMPWLNRQPARQAALRQAIERAAQGDTVRHDGQFATLDGQDLTLDFQVAPLREAGGQVTSLVACGVDVTARTRALDELEQSRAEAHASDQKKGTFLATLSHELRNPLAPIRSASYLIRRSPLPDDRARNAAAVIERQCSQLTRLVDDLMDVSRLEIGNLKLQLAEVDLREVVDNAIETSRPLIEASGHAFTLSMPDEPVPVEVDATRVAQCVSNLVNNACKFTPSPGRVDVEVGTLEEGWAAVRVRDNGQGIAPEMLGQVFELFMQEDRGGMDGNTGLGIGLALTRQLVAMHGGRVHARSEGPGRGAEFEILLPLQAMVHAPWSAAAPLAQDAQEDAPPRHEAHPGEPASQPPLVLVVDDNTDAASTLQLLLEMQGFAVVMATDGASAVAAAIEHRPRVALLDIGLPDMTGYDVARRIREASAEPAWPHRPLLVALTGWGQARDRDRAIEAGFDHHLTKPADPDKLAAIVHEHLQPA